MAKTNRLEVVQDWTPRTLPGGKYCSPSCGGPKGWCTRAAFDRATRDANALASRLGDGWEPEVWENLGWHWSVANGPVTVRLWGKTYTAEFQTTAIRNVATQFWAEASTAEEAIGLVRQDVRTFISRVEADLAVSI